jgi:hypothetical protein
VAYVHLSFREAYREGMSTKHVRTVADLVRFGASLKVDCQSCGAARTLSCFDAARLAGSQPLAQLGLRLKCARCGAKAAKLTVLPPV